MRMGVLVPGSRVAGLGTRHSQRAGGKSGPVLLTPAPAAVPSARQTPVPAGDPWRVTREACHTRTTRARVAVLITPELIFAEIITSR